MAIETRSAELIIASKSPVVYLRRGTIGAYTVTELYNVTTDEIKITLENEELDIMTFGRMLASKKMFTLSDVSVTFSTALLSKHVLKEVYNWLTATTATSPSDWKTGKLEASAVSKCANSFELFIYIPHIDCATGTLIDETTVNNPLSFQFGAVVSPSVMEMNISADEAITTPLEFKSVYSTNPFAFGSITNPSV